MIFLIFLDFVSGDLTAIVSNHLPNYLSSSKSNIYEMDWNNFDHDNFILDCLAENWNSVLKREQANLFNFFSKFS